MPTYEYQCTDCEHEFEAFQRMSDAPLSDCPECARPALKRKIGLGAGFIFKGSGFYETDFKDRSGYNKKDSAAKEGGKGADAAKDSGASKSAAEAKPAKKEAPVSNAA
ncbi:MAG: zinc ribbon domain-containing protein [Opitutales bacterium]|nr:zinc ribbon domain-containing protein [Opitutales bacterium]